MLSSLSKMKPQGVSATMQVSGSLLLLAGGADPLTPKAQVVKSIFTNYFLNCRYYLKHEQQCFIRYKTRAEGERLYI